MKEIDDAITALVTLAKEKNVNLLDRIKEIPAAKDTILTPTFNDGFAHSTARGTADKEKLETRATTAEQKLADAQKRIDQLTVVNPDVAKLHAQYGKEIAEKDAQIATAKNEASVVIGDSLSDVAGMMLIAELKSLGVDGEYARALSILPENRERVRADGKSRKFSVMQPDKSEIPFSGSPLEQIKSFAVELKGKIKNAALVQSTVEGDGTGKDTVPASNGGKPSVYDGIRARQKAKDDAEEKKRVTGDEVARRLGMKR